MATNEYLKRYADKYVGELMRGWCFEDQLALPSDIAANINAGTIKTRLGVKAYCKWWIEKRKELYKAKEL